MGFFDPESVTSYLLAVDAGIPRWLRSRRAALLELSDGLDDAISHYQTQGLPLDAAVFVIHLHSPVAAREPPRSMASGGVRFCHADAALLGYVGLSKCVRAERENPPGGAP